MYRQKSWVDEANELVNIVDVLRSIDVFVPEAILNGGNKKIYCPFGFYHSDGGATKAMRVYLASNTAYCFSCSKRYSPVGLAVAKWDCSWINAALRLLEDAGYKAKTLDERWREATMELDSHPDILALADALKMYCSGICQNWNTIQLDEHVARKLSRCLSLLDSVKTNEDAEKWLSTCKIVMTNLLGDKSNELSSSRSTAANRI